MERHVLGLSGGRDSAALAVYMRQNHPNIETEYFFTDTGKELPEVYVFLGRLEGFLGKPIRRLNPDRDFDFWLTQYKHFLPSPKLGGARASSRLDRLRNGFVQPWQKATRSPVTSPYALTRTTARATRPRTTTSPSAYPSERTGSTKLK